MTLKTGVMATENSSFFSAIAGINYILKCKLNCNNISQYCCLEQWFMCQAFYMKYGDNKKKKIYIYIYMENDLTCALVALIGQPLAISVTLWDVGLVSQH